MTPGSSRKRPDTGDRRGLDSSESTEPFETFAAFAHRLKLRLGGPLPGPDLQARMAPPHRESMDVDRARTRPHKEGAVLILLYPSAGEVATLFTVRKAELRHHGGQVSFPGGRRELGESLEMTAIREAEEEAGIDRTRIEVLGSLTPLFIPPSQFIVHPFVAVANASPEFRIEEREVERILKVP
ncbi:MAG: CoA pyrophosphatase, partial [Rhodothermia bacterium]